MESTKELNETIKSLNIRKEKNMELESHVILKQYSKLESEIESLDITNELKRETKDLIKKRIISEINLTNAKAMEAIANTKFTNENIKTIDAKIKDWASQVEFRSENVKLEKEKIKNQVKQWIKEFGLKEERFEKEKTEAIVNGIFEAVKIASGLGAGLTIGKFTKI
jgi:predicted O-linked N-acetylglucosamine transferase (SPINDLY family)